MRDMEKFIRKSIEAVDKDEKRWGSFQVSFNGAGACWAKWNVLFDKRITVDERNEIYDEVIDPLLNELDNPLSTGTYFIDVI